jgi:hypothetical protein
MTRHGYLMPPTGPENVAASSGTPDS